MSKRQRKFVPQSHHLHRAIDGHYAQHLPALLLLSRQC
ncbi:hypothetical protein MGSAQ_002683 [marine sediment metagenome]|uniref:Uncharacterized protein n=1 Tax=marine sediment metagenome TaxID=412755 RepID=A0A1B6NSC2_9ZZZZ